MDTIREWFNIVDGIVAVVLVLGLLGGVRRGLSGELLRVITIVIALLVGWYGTNMAAHWLADRSDWPDDDLYVVALLGLIVGTYTILGIIRHVFRIFLDFSFRGRLEILGGAMLGLLRATVFCAIALLAASLIPSENLQAAIDRSRTGTLVVTYLTPAYNAWAEENPNLKLPVKESGLTTTVEPIDMPAIDESTVEDSVDTVESRGRETLGPLIEDVPFDQDSE